MRTKFFQQSHFRRVDGWGLACVFVVLLAALSLVQGVSSAYAQAPGDTFVHLFEWKWTDIAEECEQFLGPNGYKAIQVSPPNEHALITDPPYPWWQRYQPVSYQLISRSGNEAEFIDMVARCHAAGVDIYVDAIINHMTGVYSQDGVPGGPPWHGFAGTPFDDYTYPSPTGWNGVGPDYIYNNFHHCGLTPNDDIASYSSREQIQTCELVNLSDLDTGTEDVQNTISAYLNKLLGMGVAGFRIDAAKHMAAADIAGILSKLNPTNLYGQTPYIFQEVIGNDAEPVKVCEYYDSGCTTPDGHSAYPNGDVTEFAYGRQLAETFRTGKLAWFNGTNQFGEAWGMIPGEYAVIFTDNHDNQRGHGGAGSVVTHHDGELYSLANAFMLAWPYGYPKVMSSYEFENSDQGPPSDASGNTFSIYSGITPDFTGWVTEHRWTPIANMVKFRKVTASAPTVDNWWDNGNNQIAFSRGDLGFIVVNHETDGLTDTLQTGMAAGRYCNVFDGEPANGGSSCTGPSVIVNSDGTAVITVDPGKAVAIHVDSEVSSSGSIPVATTFNVTAETEFGENVFIVGNIPELGAWVNDQAVALSPDNYPVWSAVVDLPPSTQVEYKYIIKNGSEVISENAPTRIFITPGGGTETRVDVWRRSPIPVTFNVEAETDTGQNVFIVGNAPELGNWDPEQAQPLSSGSYPIWSGTIELTPETEIEYKYLKKAGTDVVWESGPNRSFTTPARGTLVRDDVWDATQGNPYNADIFVRGTMNGWGISDKMTFGSDMFVAMITLDAADYQFKIADADWSAANFGAGSDGTVVTLGTPKTLARGGPDLDLSITEAGRYRFTLDVTNPEAPVVTVRKMLETNPYGVNIFVRGSMNGWGISDMMEFSEGAFTATLSLDVQAYEFKIASEDWSTADFGAGDDGSEVSLDTLKILDRGGANLSLDIVDPGNYTFTVDPTDPEEPIVIVRKSAINLPDLYVRGTMNGWDTSNKMTATGLQFTAVLVLEAGMTGFKIADENWAEANYGHGGDPTVTLDTPKTLAQGGGDLQINITEAGRYRFNLDAANPDAPSLVVRKAQRAIIHYHRKNADYDGWGLHLWNLGDPQALAPEVLDGVDWDNPYPLGEEDDFGKYAVLDLNDPDGTFGFIIHKGNEKDHGGLDMSLNPATEGFEIWMVQGYTEKFKTKEEALIAANAVGNLKEAKARWISRDSIAWEVDSASETPYLYYDPDGTIVLEQGNISFGPNGQEIPLSFNGTIGGGTPNDQKLAYLAYLSGWARVDTSGLVDLKTLLTGALAIGIKNSEGKLVDATSIQTAGVLDDLFAYDGDDLGVTFSSPPTIKLWAPTAQSVKLHLYDDPSGGTATVVEMTKDVATGVWSVTGDDTWENKFYLFEVNVFTFWAGAIESNMVTDPYSVSLAMNSTRSQIVNLGDSALKPAGWDGLQKPDLEAPEDIVLYELHVRDFSISDPTASAGNRGKFMAFTEADSNGVKHLKALAEAGLTHLHVLPVFDIATIDENPANRVELDSTMDALCAKPGVADELGSLCTDHAGRVIREVLEEAAAADPASEIPQQIVMALRPFDGFNWGYDPFHYGVPEGSYSTNPDGSARIVEFREMVKALNDMGLRVVMDVVYNHTNAARDHEKSVLDKVVPGYYYRLDDGGNIQNSTCCSDTASEHKMMEKLMLDTLKHWAVQYKVDGFRFDLMGHHTRNNMKNVRAMFDALTIASDGVDGSKIYIYGEGWKFGSIQTVLPSTDDPNDINDNAAFTQTNSAGAGIGSFNDRIRDMVRGAGFMKPPCLQGFISGMEYDPNGDSHCTIDDMAYSLLNYADNIRIGMAGNLKDYQFTGHQGNTVRGQDVAYFGGAPAGYTADPQEVINYASAHDNRTLWDYIQFQAPFDTAGRVPPKATLAERVRIQNLGLSLIALGQGIPFFHAGNDMLRSKSADEDSYDYGDWVNRLDFSYESNNWGAGLPNADKNLNEWDALRPRLRDAEITPGKDDILKTVNHFRELLQIRSSSQLFRLRTANDIEQRVRFLNAEKGTEQLSGVIVMVLSDFVGDDLDPEREMLLVAVNVTKDQVTFSHDDLVGVGLELHPVLQNSVDEVVKQSTYDLNTGTLTIPARTTVVYQEPQAGPEPTPTPDMTPTPNPVIPEPGTCFLLSIGLLGLLGLALKK